MIVSTLHDLEIMSVDFTLVFPQADSDVDKFMELPLGFDLRPDSRKNDIKLNNNLHGLK